jgi:heme a synthase
MFIKYVKWVLVFIFLVIIAGSVVRTTNSGMGCPDWPKCFGQYIPPTSMEQVLFQPNKQYNKGQFIRYNDSLWSAVNNFTSNTSFDYQNWKHYNKHGYSKIVIHQTWIEYINRLLGALLGFLVIIQAIWSFTYFKNKPIVFWLSIFLVLLTGFEAWLGKTVVDSNLAVVKISLHLAGAILLFFIQILILNKLQPKQFDINSQSQKILFALSGITILQFVLGIMVRQQVDITAVANNYLNREKWLPSIGVLYYVHRSLSLVMLLLGYFLMKKQIGAAKKHFNIVWYLLLAQLVIGIIFNYAQFPEIAQPFHLLLACVFVCYLFYLWVIKKTLQK